MKYQRGQQFLIRTPHSDLPFCIRIEKILENPSGYVIQQVGHVNKIEIDEQTLELWIENADGK